jgi:hypothetical protein
MIKERWVRVMGSGNAGLSRRNSGSLKHPAKDVKAEVNDYSLNFVEPSEVYGIDNSYRASYLSPRIVTREKVQEAA